MGLVEQVRDESPIWRYTPLGKEVDVELFEVFMGIIYEWDVPFILEEHGLLDESEFDAIFDIECRSEANAERLLSGYVKRAYFDIATPLSFYTDFSSNRIKTTACMSGRNRWSTTIPTLTTQPHHD